MLWTALSSIPRHKLFPLLAIVCLALAPMIASANGGFQFKVIAMNATTVGVEVDLRSYYEYPWPPPCTQSYSCITDAYVVRISPCPPGVPCNSGTYEFSTQYFLPRVELDYGVAYTFTGTYETRYGRGQPCQTTCTVPSTIPTAFFTTPAASKKGHWEVVPVSTDGNMMWVDVRIVDSSVDQSACAKTAACAYREKFYEIAPCPLAIENEDVNSYCNNGRFAFFERFAPETRRMALQIGQSYQFAGTTSVQGLRREMSGACVEPDCAYVEAPTPTTFTATALATRPITWGAVKSMYRN